MLTVTEIKGIKPKAKPFYIWDVDGERGTGKLGVQVTPKGSKRFTYRYFINGKAKFIAIGPFPEVSLANAREQKKKYGSLLLQGTDPKEHEEELKSLIASEKREDALKGSIKQLFDSYTQQMEKDGKRTYKAVLNSLEKEVYPLLDSNMKARDITPHEIILILSSMIKRGAVTQSNRVRSYLMAAFNYGLKHDNDPANYITEAKFGLLINPVAAIPKQKNAERVGEHYLDKPEVKMLLNDLLNEYTRFKMGDSIRHLIALCFHTGGQRPFELASSKWECVDWEKKTLLIASSVSKNKKAHLVPLTESAMFILNRQKEIGAISEFIFPHRFNEEQHIRLDSFSQSILRYRTETPNIRAFIGRDIRRTCKTLMGELGVSKSLRDRLQNHALNDVSSKHYDRYEYLPEKRQALEKWERHLNDEYVNNVVAFGGASYAG